MCLVWRLLNNIVTPAVSDLCTDCVCMGLTQWAHAPFISFLGQPACTLPKLNLPMTDVQLIECLRMLPSLVELVLDYDGPTPFLITDTLLQQLIHHPPKLRSLPLLNPGCRLSLSRVILWWMLGYLGIWLLQDGGYTGVWTTMGWLLRLLG